MNANDPTGDTTDAEGGDAVTNEAPAEVPSSNGTPAASPSGPSTSSNGAPQVRRPVTGTPAKAASGAVSGAVAAKTPGTPARKVAAKKAPARKVAAKKAAPGTAAPSEEHGPLTLAIDIGGTGLKANVLDATGALVGDRARIPTTYPMPPTGDKGLVGVLVRLVSSLPPADRISAGFPGMVRHGIVMSAPHFVTTKGPGSKVDPKLMEAWDHFDLAAALSEALGKPAKVANDADVQGLAVVRGAGFEVVLTLGTGLGSAVFDRGHLLPHQELAHQPFRKGQTYNDQLGEAARRAVGNKRWNTRVAKAIANVQGLFFFDHLYLGGGNAARVTVKALGDLGAKLSLVDNSAGILGGIRLWDPGHHGL